MSGAALLVAGLLAGGAFAVWLPLRATTLERAAAGGVVGTLATSWVAWLAAVAAGYATAAWLAPALLLGIAALLATAIRRRRRPEAAPGAARPARETWLPREVRLGWALATLPASALLARLFSTHYLPDRDGGWGSAGSTWGDLALHASLASRFAEQSRFEWSLPVLHGAPLNYPFLPDFLSGFVHRGGMSLRWALLAPGLLLAFALVQLLFLTAWRGTGSARGGLFATLLVLLDGSAAGLAAAWTEWRGSGLSLGAFLAAMPRDYAHVPAINLRFSNIVTDALLPQRGMLAGMATALVAVMLLRGAWEAAERRVGDGAASPPPAPRALLAAAGALLGLLPFVHVHSFLVLAGLTVWLAAARLIGAGGARRRELLWLLPPALGVALAAPQLAWQLSHAQGSFLRWRLGWMSAPGEDPFLFWLRNLGVLTPFLVVAPWLLARWDPFWRQTLAALLVLFALGNAIRFQPHEYDNLKLLFYAFLALALIVARTLAGWWASGGARRVAAAAVLLLATATGGLAVLRETTLAWPFLEREEVELGFALRRLTPPEARFLTADKHNHPVPIVAGRQIVLGYRGWLWTYGASTGQHLRDVTAMYSGAPGAEELLRRYGVGYVVVGPHERRAFPVREEWLAERHPLVLETASYRVYRVAPGAGAAGAGAAGGVADGLGSNTSAPGGTHPASRSTSK